MFREHAALELGGGISSASQVLPTTKDILNNLFDGQIAPNKFIKGNTDLNQTSMISGPTNSIADNNIQSTTSMNLYGSYPMTRVANSSVGL